MDIKKEKIIYKTLDEIMPYERNPRDNAGAVDYVANSIKEFGFKQPIVIDAAGVIIAGHTRYAAAKSLGIEKVPCIIADDLSPYEVSAYRIADNKVAEFSNWDFSLLEQELEGIEEMDMSAFGFEDEIDLPNIDGLFDDYTPDKEKERKAKLVQCPNCGEEFEI